MSYSIHVQSKDGVSFFVEGLQLDELLYSLNYDVVGIIEQ